jgi:hypothetical protein
MQILSVEGSEGVEFSYFHNTRGEAEWGCENGTKIWDTEGCVAPLGAKLSLVRSWGFAPRAGEGEYVRITRYAVRW